MTSTDKIKTPIMELYFNEKVSKAEAQSYAAQMQKVNLSQLIKTIEVEEWKQLMTADKRLLSYNDRKRFYKITLQY